MKISIFFTLSHVSFFSNLWIENIYFAKYGNVLF